MSDTIVDVNHSKASSSTGDIAVRIILVALAFTAVQLPLFEVMNSGKSVSYNAVFPMLLGGFGYAVPALIAVVSGLGFLSRAGAVRKISDALALAISVVTGGYIAFVVHHAATNAPGASSSSATMSLDLGAYTFFALILLAAWNFISTLRR